MTAKRMGLCYYLGGVAYTDFMVKKRNGDSPATQHDLTLLGGELTRRIDGLEERMDRAEGILEKILSVVESIEGRMKEMTDHGDRLDRIKVGV